MNTRAVATLFVIVLAFGAVVQVFLPLKARAHDIYMDWKTQNGVSCCHDRDCAPATAWTDMAGNLYVRQNGQTYTVHPDAVLKIPSPDGRSHACIIGGYVICAVIAPPKS